MDWLKVRKGDTVTVEVVTGKGGTVTGELVHQGATTVTIGELPLSKGSLKIIDHKPVFKDGDIAVYTSPYNGIWVGIYDASTGKFYDSNDKDVRVPLFDTSDSKRATVIGNIKELA